MFDPNRQDVVDLPFPHIVRENILPASLFSKLREEFPPESRFPDTGKLPHRKDLIAGTHGRTELDDFLVESPAWRALFEYVRGDDMAACVHELFRGYGARYGFCPSPTAPPDFGISVCRTGYQVVPHHGHRHHVGEGILFLGDEEVEEGGALLLHEQREPLPLEDCPWLPEVDHLRTTKEIRPAANVGVLWLNTPNSYHSVSRLRGVRRICYFAWNVQALSAWVIGARHDVVVVDPTSPARARRRRVVCR